MSYLSYPKVVALDTDWTIWKEYLDPNAWGKGPNHLMPVEDNIERPDDDPKLLRDRSNHANYIRVFDDISRVVNDILRNGAKLAIVSRNPSKPMCDRALYYFNAVNPSDDREWSIIDLAQYVEIVDESKVQHFRRIREWSGNDSSDLVLYDDEAFNNVVRIELGITFQFVRDGRGLTWETYQRGLHAWRRAKNMAVSSPSTPPRPVFIGYSGLSPFWIDLVAKGEGIVDPKTPYRWGYALYVADTFGIAKFFRDWDEEGWGNPSEICEVWVKDYDAWAAINKVWVPENGEIPQMNNMNWPLEESGKNQENRDRFIAQRWGVQTPYILFSRHHYMNTMPDFARPRFNEMVVYTQIQRSLFKLVQLDRSQWGTIKPDYGPYPFHKQIDAWNITLLNETIRESQNTPGETDLFQ